MVKSERGHVQSFSVSKSDLDNIVLRCNERYDILLKLKEQNEHKMKNIKNQSKMQKKDIESQHKRTEKRIMGVCILRRLSIFDVGISFMADSLHNSYNGAFVSEKLLMK